MLVRLGEEMRNARQKKAVSLEAVAGPAKISAAYLHKLERGAVNNPSPRVLARIAAALGMPYLRVMELAGYLDERQSREVRTYGSAPHPLAGQDLTSEEWRAVGSFISELVARRKAEDALPQAPS